jgi:uncharacterized protein YlzI (FlbEa/FlbD family)
MTKFIELTDSDHRTLVLNVEGIAVIRSDDRGRTLISMDDGTMYTVRQTISAVMEKINPPSAWVDTP